MGFGSKCSILKGLVINVENPKLNIADMWLIPFDRVTYYVTCWVPSVTRFVFFDGIHISIFTFMIVYSFICISQLLYVRWKQK